MSLKDKIAELEKRIEELEKRPPVVIHNYPPVQQPSFQYPTTTTPSWYYQTTGTPHSPIA